MNKDKHIATLNQKINEMLEMGGSRYDHYYRRGIEWARDAAQSEPEETCEYCQGEKLLSERELEQYSDVYIGFGVDISEGKLLIESCATVGRPSRDYTFSEKEIEINYCPMCGRRIKAGE